MAKVNIAGLDIDLEAHRNNHPTEHAAIFGHLPIPERYQAIAEFNAALAKDNKKDEKEQATADDAPAKSKK